MEVGGFGELRNFSISSDLYSDSLPETSSVTYIGGPVQTRTADLLRVNRSLMLPEICYCSHDDKLFIF